MGPMAPFKVACGPLAYQSSDTMCGNEFLYYWESILIYNMPTVLQT